MLVEQRTARIVVLRRTANGFQREEHAGQATVALPEIGCELPLAEVYDGVDLRPARQLATIDA